MCGLGSMLFIGLKFLLLLFFFFEAVVWLLIFTLLRAHVGYLHFLKLLLQDTCINTIENAIDRETMHGCYDFIKIRRERRHFKTLERQLSKFYRLCQRNTIGCSSSQHGEHGGHGHTMV